MKPKNKIRWHVLKKQKEEIEFNPKGEYFHFACCDCGLVHDMGLAIEKNGNIGMAFQRNEKLTKRNRNMWKNPQ